jgi:hypothetical protein
MERNEFGQMEIVQFICKNKLYVDWSTMCELLDQKSTNLFRIINKLESFTEIPTIRYKNRKYFLTEWVLNSFWKTISDAQKAGKL